jgi:RNA polymerase sigma-70 factor, ECF subfamily
VPDVLWIGERRAGLMSVEYPLEATEEALLARLREGDRDVLGELFGLHRPRLWRMVRFRMDRRLLARMDPDDVLQEAFLAGTRRIDNFLSQPEASLFVWLRLIVMQTLCDLHRHHVGAQMRDARRDVPIEHLADGSRTSVCLATLLAGTMTSPSQAAAALELTGRLQKAIETMTDVDQEIIALRHFEDLTNLETSEVLGLTPQAASNRYLRAIARLKEILAPFRDPKP